MARFFAKAIWARSLLGQVGWPLDLNTAPTSGFGVNVYQTDGDTQAPGDPHNVHRMFCAGHSMLPDGDLLIFGQHFAMPAPPSSSDGICDHSGTVGVVNCDQGGTENLPTLECNCYLVASGPAASIFDIEDASNAGLGRVTRLTDMPTLPHNYGGLDSSRYYPGGTSLPSGNVLVVGGQSWEDDGDCCHTKDGGARKPYNRNWIEFDWQTESWITRTNRLDPLWVANPVDEDDLPGVQLVQEAMPFDYGKVFSLPGGLAWLGWPGKRWGVESEKARFWPWPWETSTLVSTSNAKNNARVYSAPVILTLTPPYTQEQKVMFFGGGDPTDQAIATCEYVDFASATPQWTLSGDTLAHRRARPDAVMLPDGNVLIVGGGRNDNGEDYSPVLTAEMYDPILDTFKEMDLMEKPRIYHSWAVLLPDGRVFVSGNDRADDFGGYGSAGDTYEIFWPPYLFTDSGWADRPTIDTYDDEIFYGQSLFATFTAPNGTSFEEAVLVAPSNTTHSYNFSQRRVVLEFDEDDALVGKLTATAPWTPEVAPPGDYMLFVLTKDDVTDQIVPSVGKFVRLKPGNSTAETGSDTVWGGTIRLDQDFRIEQGDKLTILPGTEVIVAETELESFDREDLGDLAQIEIIVEGQLVAEGNVGDQIVFRKGTGATAWGGLDLRLEGEVRTGYGYVWTTEPLSSLKNVEVRDAEYGIRISEREPTVVATVAPNIENVSFSSIEENLHIYLNNTDVVIPAGYHDPSEPEPVGQGSWDLLAGTNVVAAAGTIPSDADAPWGTSNRVDLLVDGKIYTEDTDGAGAEVVFGPESVNEVGGEITADDWGGMFLSSTSAGSVLDNIKIGYAANPLFMFYPDALTTLEYSTIHDFADVGLHIQGAQGVGAIISTNTIQRSTFSPAPMKEELGRRGVYLDAADNLEFLTNTVDMSSAFALNQISEGTTTVGIEVYYGKNYCESSPVLPSYLLLRENTVFGPAVGNFSQSTETGMKLTWVCGEQDRDVLLAMNSVYWFKDHGVDFFQNSDLQVTCNWFESDGRPVNINRDETAPGPGIRFLENAIVSEFDDRAAVTTNLAQKTKLGGLVLPDRSGNYLFRRNVSGQEGFWIFENDGSTPTADVDARRNSWIKGSPDNGGGTIETVGSEISKWNVIESTIAQPTPTEGDVDVSSWKLTYMSPPMCTPPYVMPGNPTTSAQQGGVVATEPEDPVRSERGGAPVATRLYAQPIEAGRDVGTVRLDVAPSNAGHWTIGLYNVEGRLVTSLHSGVLRSGEHSLPLRGSGIASGVYFVRAEGPGFERTRKWIRLR